MGDLRFPIGKFQHAGEITEEQRKAWLQDIEDLPVRLSEAVAGLSDAQLNTPYRPEGWTLRQVVHHVADSHMNSYIRFKLALTEELPTVKLYEEAAWAELDDAKNAPVNVSLQLLETLHHRWVMLIRSLEPWQWEKSFVHPDSGEVKLATNLGIYAWHGKHHTAHITTLRERMGWF